MKQNRFFSAVYIIGTGLAISMVMVMAVVYHIRTAAIAPEINRDRMLYLTRALYVKEKGSINGFIGTGTAKECLFNLKTPEAVSVATHSFFSFVSGDFFARLPGGDDPVKVSIKGTNADFWRVFRFNFIEGGAYETEEFQSGIPRIVLSRSTALRLFKRTDVTGQALLLNEVEYTVSGIVSDVSAITPAVNADVWIPYTSLSQMQDKTEEGDVVTGYLEAYVLARTKRDFGTIQQELDEQVRRYNTMLAGGKMEMPMPFLEHDRKVLYALTNDEQADLVQVTLILLFIVGLFLLIPALNLSGLNDSRMQDRMSELGLRKAFGATRGVLFTQVFIENLMLMLPGGLVGLCVSWGLVSLLRNLLLTPDFFSMQTGGVSLSLTSGMLVNFEVFFYAFGACLILNMLSSFIPVWRAVRKQITEALNSQ